MVLDWSMACYETIEDALMNAGESKAIARKTEEREAFQRGCYHTPRS